MVAYPLFRAFTLEHTFYGDCMPLFDPPYTEFNDPWEGRRSVVLEEIDKSDVGSEIAPIVQAEAVVVMAVPMPVTAATPMAASTVAYGTQAPIATAVPVVATATAV